MTHTRFALVGAWLAVLLAGVAPPALAQDILTDVLVRHGVTVKGRGPEGAFDDGLVPAVIVAPGAFAAPLALLQSADGASQVRAAYTFGVLAGRYARTVPPGDLAAAGTVLLGMMGSEDRHARIAGARVAGRVFAKPLLDTSAPAARPAGLVEAAFALLNRDSDVDQLAAMDALGQLRDASAAPSLAERFQYYRDRRKRVLAGGAIEAIARIGDPSSAGLVKALVGDKWAERRDAPSLAVAFARQRLLKDGSVATIEAALKEKQRRQQARAYLTELAELVP